MKRKIALSLAALAMLGTATAFAQDDTTEPPTLEVTIIPAGATFFQAKGSSPDFTNYTYGGAVTYNINRFVGIEGEVGGTAGITQNLDLGTAVLNAKTPNSLTYNGNVVVSVPTGHSVVPFVTGGVGGLTLFQQADVAVSGRTTFLTGNVGGGVKWYAPNGRWGLRADYRFIGVRSNDQAPVFFGQQARYGHRVYGAVIINALRR